ncbi:putative UDP-glucose glucosyltransferase [Humulus lupulus]|uniref:putative UDP-glucose glucosyltransferase n=1 Tax=Humulus lupulus TaxID=3486 RepID=UPI002B412945|nr:putative UDP-glucose glucosyltransferase [Humulus lupulus]
MDRKDQAPIHILLVCFPAQGLINPMLRLGKRLAANEGLLITFTTIENLGKEMRRSNHDITDQPTPVGHGFMRFEFFDDGLPADDLRRTQYDFYMTQLELAGKESLHKLIKKQSIDGRPVSCIINNPFLPWACDIGEDLGIPCSTLWVQSCALFATYYHYFHKTVPFPTEAEPEIDVLLPSMPALKHDEIASFLHPTRGSYKVIGQAILGQFKNLSKSFCVLADTFEELEHEIIQEMSMLCPIKAIGPLFKDPKGATIKSTIRADVMKADDDCMEWLDSKPLASVVYISFGTVIYLKQEQVDEIAHALLSSTISFLWVVKPPSKDSGLKVHDLPDRFVKETRGRGKVVKWSPQEKVLAHPSVMCFLTHCGWNSSMEALTSGVPVVTFPQWGDQVTNAKFLVDVFGVGVRLCRGEMEDRVISWEEVKKSLMEVMNGTEKAAELKRNALKWKMAAEAAANEGGSSNRNISEFLDEIRKKSLCVSSTSF